MNFNPRSREGSDFSRPRSFPCFLRFQSSLPRGERRKSCAIPQIPKKFQSSLPRGERHGSTYHSCHHVHFNPRSREGSDGIQRHGSGCRENFNPRSREGSDLMLNILYFYDFLFQSSLPRGERPPFPLFCLPVVSDFNPRSREGSDRDTPSYRWRCTNFNPRSREGSDLMLNILYFYDFLFQSSLPRGERPPFPLFCLPVVSDFNPRSREGSDTLPRSRFPSTVISILAPARGATACIIGMSDCPIVISILAPARGATLSQRFRTVTWLIFQSSLPRGERLYPLTVIYPLCTISILAPARGATRC